jgi:Tol biopolymer transport system component
VVLGGCGFQSRTAVGDASGGDAPGSDAPGSGSDSGSGGQPDCFQRWFDGGPSLVLSSPQELTALSSGGNDRDPWVSVDGKRLYFGRDPGAQGKGDIYLATRSSTADAFASPQLQVALDTSDDEGRASLTGDESMLIFSGNHNTTGNRFQLFVSKRDTTGKFPSPSGPDQVLVASINTDTANYFDPFLTNNGLKLYLAPDPDGGAMQQIAVATRADITQNFMAWTPVPGINSTGGDADPAVSRDDRIIVFTSRRSAGAGLGATNLWYATRQKATDDFSAPRLIPTVNGDQDDGDPVLGDDGCDLYFASTRNGGRHHLFHASVTR